MKNNHRHGITVKILPWMLVTGLCTSGCSLLPAPQPDEKTPEPTAVPAAVPAETAQPQNTPSSGPAVKAVRAEAVHSDIYSLDDISFDFAIVTLRVLTDGTDLSLGQFRTDEGIVLSETETYVAELADHAYYPEKQNTVYALSSAQTEYAAKIFVPFAKGRRDVLSVSCDDPDVEDLKIDLSSVTGSGDMLKYNNDEVISDGETFEMTVSAAYDITGSYLFEIVNSQTVEYLLPSTTRVYVFRIDANSLGSEEVVIEEAQYVSESNDETLEAIEAGVRSEKYDNILGRPIHAQESGYLFFYAYDPDSDPVYYNGYLQVRLKGEDTWIRVNADLNGIRG